MLPRKSALVFYILCCLWSLSIQASGKEAGPFLVSSNPFLPAFFTLGDKDPFVFSPFHITVSMHGDSATANLLWDSPKKERATLKAQLLDMEGNSYKTWEKAANLKPNATTFVGFGGVNPSQFELSDDKAIFVVEADLSCKCDARRRLRFFKHYRHLTLPDPGLESKTVWTNEGWTVVVSAKRLALNVFLQPTDETVSLGENAFDLLPKEEKTLKITGWNRPDVAPTIEMFFLKGNNH